GTNPGGPDHGAAVDALAAPELDARGGHARHRCAQPHLHAERLEIAPCARTQRRREGAEHGVTAFEEHDPELLARNAPIVVRHDVTTKRCERSGGLDTRRTRTHDDDREAGSPFWRIGLYGGTLELLQDVIAQLASVLDVVEAPRVLAHSRDTEVG